MGNLPLVMIALGLLLVGGAATTATGADACGGAGHHLALASASRRVAESCAAAGTPTASCCESVIATVPCVCRVAVRQQPQDLALSLGRLNASRLVALYSSCRGRLRLRGTGYLATAACRAVLAGEHPSFVTSSVGTVNNKSPTRALMLADANQEPEARGREPVVPAPPIPSSCDSTSIASQLVEHCNIGNIRPSRRCCVVVLAIIDEQDSGCLCMVVEEAEFTKSYLSVSAIWGYYRACGGHQQRPPKDTDACEHAPAPTPPPPPPPPSPPRPPSRSPPAPPKRPSKATPVWTAVWMGWACFAGFIFLVAIVVTVAVKTKKYLTRELEVPNAIRVGEEQRASLQLGEEQRASLQLQLRPPARARVDAEVVEVQLQRAVARPSAPPLFPPPLVPNNGKAPLAPPFIPPPPLFPLKLPTRVQEAAV